MHENKAQKVRVRENKGKRRVRREKEQKLRK